MEKKGSATAGSGDTLVKLSGLLNNEVVVYESGAPSKGDRVTR